MNVGRLLSISAAKYPDKTALIEGDKKVSYRRFNDRVNRLANKYKDDSEVLFIALNDEPEEKVVNFLQRWPFRFMHIADAEQYTNKLQSRLVKTYPQTIILNKESVVVFDQSNGTADIFSLIDSKIQEIKNQ